MPEMEGRGKRRAMRDANRTWVLLGGLALATAACSAEGEPSVYTSPVELTLKADASTDVADGVLSAIASMNSADDGAYNALLVNARIRLKRSPSSVNVTTATLTAEGSLGAPGTVFESDFALYFFLDNLPTLVAVGTVPEISIDPELELITNPTGELDDDQVAKLLSGGFNVLLRGKATKDFIDAKRAGTLRLEMDLAALE
jgi:hypothetical protein